MNEPPQKPHEDPARKEKEQRKNAHPEFIILDDEEEAQSHEQLSDLARVLHIRMPWRARLFLALMLFLAVFVFVFALAVWMATGIVHLLTLMRIDDLGALNQRMFRHTRRAAVFILSLFITLFSPPLGLGTLMLYFILYEDANSNVSRIVRSNLFKYN